MKICMIQDLERRLYLMRYEYMHAVKVSTAGSTASKVSLGAVGGEFSLCLARGETRFSVVGRGFALSMVWPAAL